MIATFIRSRLCSVAALGVVVLSLALPPNGLGLPMCTFNRLTHAPCLGCGLTRSFIALGHGNLSWALAMHPFGVVLFPLAVTLALLLLLSAERRERLAQALDRRARLLAPVTTALLALFVVYGIGRMVAVLAATTPAIW